MKAKINSGGLLHIERAGKFKEVLCPKSAEIYGSCGEVQTVFGACGDWCALFGDFEASTPTAKIMKGFIFLCESRCLNLSEFTDEREANS